MENLVGRVLSGRYTIVELMFRGDLGTVMFLAQDTETGNSVSIKVLPPALAEHSEAFEKFIEEGAGAARAGQPTAAQFLDAGQTEDGSCFVVYEFLEGESLAGILARETILTYQRIFSIVIPICSALEEIHHEGIIHRGIRPEAIVVCDTGDDQGKPRIKLLDFGMAGLREAIECLEQVPPGVALAPPFYMAPELVGMGGAVDGRADVYSLGVVMYRAVVGKAPYEGQSFEEIKERILAQQPEPPRAVSSEIPEEINSLIMCSMDKDPDNRFQNASELRAVIKNIIEFLESMGDLDETSTLGGETTRVFERADEAGESTLDRLATEIGIDEDMPEEWQKAVEQLAAIVDAEGDADGRLKAGKKLALIYENRMFDTEGAKSVYEKLLTIDETAVDILDELDRIYTISLDWPSLVGIMERKVVSEENPESRAELLRRCGELSFDQLGDPGRAITSYRAIVDGLQVDHRPALEALLKIYGHMQMWHEYVDTLERLIPLSPEQQQIQMHLEIATTYSDRLGSSIGARMSYENILRIQPDNDMAAALLASLPEESRELPDEETQRVPELAEQQEALIESAVTEIRISPQVQAGAVEQPLEDAAPAPEEALWPGEQPPEEFEAGREIISILTGESRPPPPPAISADSRPPPRPPEEAVLSETPAAPDAIDVPDEAPVLPVAGEPSTTEAPPGPEEEESGERLVTPSSVVSISQPEEQAGKPLAPSTVVAISGKPPESETITAPPLYDDAGDSGGIGLETIRAQALSPDFPDADELADADALALEDISDEAMPLQALNDSAALDAALDMETDDAFEEQGAQPPPLPPAPSKPSRPPGPPPPPPPKPSRPDVDDILQQGEDAVSLIQDLLDQYEAERDKQKRSRLLLKIAVLYEDAMDDEEAASLLIRKAFLENSEDQAVVDELERITAKSGEWATLVAMVNEKIGELGNRSETVPLYLQVGKWYTERLGHPQYATAIYGKVLQLDPDNIEALSAVADLYKAAGQWDNYVHYLKIQIEKAKSDETKKKILLKLGRTYHEELGRSEEAVETLKKVFSIDPFSSDVLGALEEIYRARDMYGDLVGVLKKKIEQFDGVGDAELLESMFLEVAHLYEVRLQHPVSAVDWYRKVIEADETNMDALRGLERLFMGLEQVRDLIDVLEMQLRASTIDKEKVDLLRRIAGIYEKDFVRPELAREKYEQILSIDPDNGVALENLERIYRGLKMWDELVDMLEKHVMVAAESERKTGLMLEEGRILKDMLNDMDRAVEVYQGILDINEAQPEALRMLGNLYEEQERYEDAFSMMERLQQNLNDPVEQTKLMHRMGVMLDAQLGRREDAIKKYHDVIALAPTHLDSLGALRTIYFDKQDWDMAAQIIDAEQKYTTDPMQRSELLYARGRILFDYKARPEEAVECFELAMQLWPDNGEAARPLAEHYLLQERWSEAEPILETIIRKGAEGPEEELLPWYLHLAGVAALRGNAEKSLMAYQGAFEIEQSNIDALKGMAHTLMGMERWQEAFKYFHMIVSKYPETQNTQEKIEIYYYLGSIKLQQGESRKALKLFETILEIDQHHRPTLDALIEIFEKHSDFEQLIYFKKLVAETLDGDEKFDVLIETGDIWEEKLHNSIKAIAMYNEALKLKPSDRGILHKLMSLYSSTKQWPKAVDVLKRIAEFEDDAPRRARYYNSIAVIYQSEVKDYDSAIEYFNSALDVDVENLKNFEAIEKILTLQKNWKSLEKNYRRMLHRIAGKGDAQLEETLLNNLGEIYRTRMKNFEAAAEVFKMASNMNPDNFHRREILAELYGLMPERWQHAVSEHQYLLRKNPKRMESYRELRRIFHGTEQYDKSWCLCQALSLMNQADEEERAFYDYYRMKEYRMPRQAVDNESWLKLLFHPDENVYIGKIFELITPVLYKKKSQTHKAYNLKRKDRQDPVAGQDPNARAFGVVGSVLNLMLPEIYVTPQQPMLLQYAITEPPASVVGAPLIAGRLPPQELLFIVTKHLAYYRGEHYMRLLEPTVAGLTTLLLAAIKVGNPYFQLSQDVTKQVTPVVQIIRKGLLPVQMEQLGSVARAFVNTKEPMDLKKWVTSVELTACRAAFLLCNDLQTAAKIVSAEPPGISDVPLKDKINELILFSVSEPYFKLRKLIGFDITFE
ncbi:MAG: tetratricopeptide repeat protein [Pseudomonadota bacterium]